LRSPLIHIGRSTLRIMMNSFAFRRVPESSPNLRHTRFEKERTWGFRVSFASSPPPRYFRAMRQLECFHQFTTESERTSKPTSMRTGGLILPSRTQEVCFPSYRFDENGTETAASLSGVSPRLGFDLKEGADMRA